MSDQSHLDEVSSFPGQYGGGGSPTTTSIRNLTDEEMKDFRRTWEIHLLPAITQILDQANAGGGQVLFHRRQFITIVTREEAPFGLRNQVYLAVAVALHEDIRAKISVQFEVGELVRS